MVRVHVEVACCFDVDEEGVMAELVDLFSF